MLQLHNYLNYIQLHYINAMSLPNKNMLTLILKLKVPTKNKLKNIITE
jgi:hypothetical protein